MPNRDDFLYLAAMVDGEGTITIDRPDRGSCTLRPRLSVANTNPILPVWLTTTFGGRTYIQPPRRGTKRCYEWFTYGKVAIELITEIFPFLKLKVAQAEVALAFWKMKESWRMVPGRKTLPGYFEEAIAYKQAVNILNRKGKELAPKGES